MKKILVVAVAALMVISFLVIAADVNPFIARPKDEQVAWVGTTFNIVKKTQLDENDLYNLRLFVSSKTLGLIWIIAHNEPVLDWQAIRDAGVTRANCYILSVFYDLTGDFTKSIE